MIRFVFILQFFLFTFCGYCGIEKISGEENEKFWTTIQEKLPEYSKIFRKFAKYRFEIIYTRVERNLEGEVQFKCHHYGDSVSYFYPASIIKLPTAVFTFEKIRLAENIKSSYRIWFDTSKFCNGYQYENYYYDYRIIHQKQTLQEYALSKRLNPEFYAQLNPGLKISDTLYPGMKIRVSKQQRLQNFSDLISSMLIYSDNTAYNKLFEFVTSGFMSRRFRDLNLKRSRIVRRLALCSMDEYARTKSCTVFSDDVDPKIVSVNSEKDQLPIQKLNTIGTKVGRKSFVNGKKKRKPKDFSQHNYIPLEEINQFLVDLVFQKQEKKYAIHESDWRMLMRWLGQYPSEVNSLIDTVGKNVPDGITNFLFTGRQTIRPSSERIINIVGQAYGFTTDCAYYFDPSNGVEFFLSMRIYTNKNKTMGDDKYEYETIAFPLMKDLGLKIAEYEKQRKKEILPVFTELRSIFGN